MPHIVETPIQAYAHCLRARCDGYNQQAVDALSHETHWAFKDNGGDFPGIERSHIVLKFVNEDDAQCPECGGPRELAQQPRPQYVNESGHDPMYLVSQNAKPFNAAKQRDVQNERVTELEGELSEMKGQMQALMAALKDKAA